MESERLNNLEETLDLLKRKAIRTSQGDFVRIDDVRRLMTEEMTARELTKKADKEEERPKDMNAAKRMAARDPEIRKGFPIVSPKLGRSIEAHSSSRT